MTSRTWSDGQVAQLKKLVRHTRMTYDQIGEKIGKPRGAVCAKVDRLGIGRRTDYIKPDGSQRATSKKMVRNEDNDALRVLEEHLAASAGRKLVSLHNLDDDACHFPFGDPLESKEIYCGEPAEPGLSYCRSCASRIYEPIEVKRHVAPRPKRQDERRPIRDAVLESAE